ncbi:N2227-domain-containing protein [Hyphopichia burtonii NRRL Y-1933]|uniref:carnosine N-methyltransferase n=1 Tax=Hyphopichia burtonii NRRL Y-1933 TaxID=984485 RepID=A0A1E4RCL4_9ASCO|nr:N2227-domain-containing protein [Hyphopichia burtonii NRRL Y-1933]ODV64963.1 N2227-domain-containing protein [Hyphopichia burtonii NRRL Y-1933]
MSATQEDYEEFKALTSTLSAFYNYHKWEYEELIKPRKLKLASLSDEEQELIPWYPKHIDDINISVGINEEFTKALATSILLDWGVSNSPDQWSQPTPSDFDKVRSTLLQLSREWSTDGINERKIGYENIIDELTELYPNVEERQNVKILVPGCGLGRLVLELVMKGFWTQGNEFSYHMLLTSNFILNHCIYPNHYTIFPFLHKSSHLSKKINQIRPITIPDINPLIIHDLKKENPSIPYEELMSMTAGSFVDLYGPPSLSLLETYTDNSEASEFRKENKESFDVLTTCFFIDTASNIIDYLKTIHYSLKPNGIWINFGPLLWHFEDYSSTHHISKKLKKDGPMETIPNILKGLELSRDDLIELAEKIGFKFEKRISDIESTYSSDVRALGEFVYKCEYWVARKI